MRMTSGGFHYHQTIISYLEYNTSIMKTFEIEVVRTYTTTVEVELPDNFTKEQITQCVTGNFEWNKHRELHEPYDMVWDEIANGELEQCDTELIDYKVKLNK